MIFVTVGGQTPFDRLVRTVDNWALQHACSDAFAQIGDTAWRPLTTVTSAADGKFAQPVRLELSAKLRASIADGQIRSAPVVVALEPLLTISSTARATKVGRSIPVSTRLSPAKAATRVTLFECSLYTHGWHAVAAKPPGLSGRITFRWTAGYGRTLLRAEVERRDAAPGFLPGQSSRPHIG